jgi:hypothetical protein
MRQHTWRAIEGITKEHIRLLAQAANNRWRSGETVYREMSLLRVLTVAKFYGDRVATDVSWLSDFIEEDDELFPQFRDAVQVGFEAVLTGLIPPDGTPTSNIYLQAALNFTGMKALEISDRPCWYSMSEGLVYSLLGTRLREVYPDDVRLPFPGLFVEIPPGILKINNNLTGSHEVRALSICEGNPMFPEGSGDGFRMFESGRRILVMVYCEPNEQSIDAGDDNILYLNIPVYNPEKSIETLLQEDREIVGEALAIQEDRDGGEFVGQPKTFGEIRQLIRSFVINFLLYLRSPEADIRHANADRITRLRKEKKGSKKHRVQIERLQKEPSWLAGSKIVLRPDLREAVRESLSRRKGKSLTFKVLVSGFWRKQWYGKKTPENPKGTEQRPKWIEPYVRGGELPGTVLGHEYEVKGDKKWERS